MYSFMAEFIVYGFISSLLSTTATKAGERNVSKMKGV